MYGSLATSRMHRWNEVQIQVPSLGIQVELMKGDVGMSRHEKERPLPLSSFPDPTHKKGLVTLLAFLSCADSAVILPLPTKKYWCTRALLHQHNQEKRAMSPDPFPFSGWGLGMRLLFNSVFCSVICCVLVT